MINKYNWKGINYSSKIEDWKRFEKNNPTIGLNVLLIKEMEICPVYISKINSVKNICNKNSVIILLVISNEEKERKHYLAVVKLSTLLKRIPLKHKSDFHCLNFLHFFRTENNLKSNEKVCENNDCCGIVLPF